MAKFYYICLLFAECECVHHSVHVEISGRLSGVSSSIAWVLRFKLSSSGLVAITFIC